MRTVFLDSVGLLATWDTRDQWHAAASNVFHGLLKENAILLTTELVLRECGNAAARKPYRARVQALRLRLASQGRIIAVDPPMLDQTWNTFASEGIGAAGPVDQASFIVMRCANIVEAFTNDQHFKSAGFITLF